MFFDLCKATKYFSFFHITLPSVEGINLFGNLLASIRIHQYTIGSISSSLVKNQCILINYCGYSRILMNFNRLTGLLGILITSDGLWYCRVNRLQDPTRSNIIYRIQGARIYFSLLIGILPVRFLPSVLLFYGVLSIVLILEYLTTLCVN